MSRKHVSIILPDGLIDPGLIPAQSWASVTGKPVPIEALSAVTLAADKLVYADGVDSFATTDLTAYGRGLIGVADEAAFKAMVNLEIGVDIQAQIAAGTSAQYYRGDKTWATLNQAAVAGLTTADSPTFAGVTAEGSDAFFVANFTGVGGNFSGLRFRKGGLDRYTNALNSSGDLVFSRFNSSGVYQADPLRLAADGAVQIPSSNTAGLQLYNTADQTTNYERLSLLWSANQGVLTTEFAGTGSGRALRLSSNRSYLLLNSTDAPRIRLEGNSSATAGTTIANVNGSNTATSGTNVGFSLTPTYNQTSSSAANTDLLINRTETAVGSGAQYLIQAQQGGSDRFLVSNTGSVALASSLRIGNAFVSISAKLRVEGNLISAAWGTNGIQQRNDAATYTDASTAASGTAASAVFSSFARPTLAATNASVTTTDAATVYIAGAPANGTNNTITNPYALWVDDGTSRFDGVVRITDAAATTARLYILGGASGAPLVTLERTVGASARWNWSLAGGGLTFTDELGNNTPALNVFGTGGTNEIYVGQKGKTFSDANTSLISGTTFSSSAGTNVPGQSLTIQGGLGTGNAASGDVLIKVGTAQASGTTAQTSSTVAQFTRTGLNNTVIGATTPAAGSFTTLAASTSITANNGSVTTSIISKAGTNALNAGFMAQDQTADRKLELYYLGSAGAGGYGAAAGTSVINAQGALTLSIDDAKVVGLSSTGLTVTGELGGSGTTYLKIGNSAAAPGSGNTTTGVTADGGNGIVYGSRTSGASGIYNTNADGELIRMHRSGSLVGTISVTTTSTSYNTSSDARLKTDLGAFDLRDLAAPLYALKLRKYRWNVWGEDSERFAYGVFAQEAHETNPWMTSYDAQSDRWSVNWTAEVPNLIAAVQLHEIGQQDHEHRLKALETENAALRAEIVALKAA